MSFIKSFYADEQGATAIEYALIAGLISIAIIGGVTSLQTSIANSFNNAAAPL